MEKLVQTETHSIVYGDFHGNPDQELFRCPRELDDKDLRSYINDNRALVGFEEATGVENVNDMKRNGDYLGYYRLYFRKGWYGAWMEYSADLGNADCAGVEKICEWLSARFPDGCSRGMSEWLSLCFSQWDGKNRFLLKPLYSDHYKVLFDTTYGNGDYPVRIYVFA